MTKQTLQEMLSQFQLVGKLLHIDEFKRGHIHDTYISHWQNEGVITKFVHQKINLHVFPDVDNLMSNIISVTEHVQKQLSVLGSNDKIFSVQKTTSGKSHALVFSGDAPECWRTLSFVENTKSYNTCDDPRVAKEAAAACGRFLGYLKDLDPNSLHVTIKDFLNSKVRLQQLEQAVSQDVCSRRSECAEEVQKCFERMDFCGLVADRLGSPELPLWVTHNDTKLNNVLFDETTEEAVSVVDLDTCMPGSILFDFGDLVRTTSVLSAEDEPDPERVRFDLDLFDAISQGFVSEIASYLTPYEKEILYLAPKLLTFTLAMRFLADHLNGDKYFKVHFPGHNLQRARSQLRVVECMEGLEEQMKTILESHVSS